MAPPFIKEEGRSVYHNTVREKETYRLSRHGKTSNPSADALLEYPK